MISISVLGTIANIYFSDSDIDRKSTRLNSSHLVISYAVFCLKKKKTLALHCPVGEPRRPAARPVLAHEGGARRTPGSVLVRLRQRALIGVCVQLVRQDLFGA